MQIKRAGWLGFAIALFAGCVSIPPPSTSDGRAITSGFQDKVRQDGELNTIVLGIGDAVPRDRGFRCPVVMNGKMWSDLTRPQQKRVLEKLGTHLQESLYAVQPAKPRNIVTLELYDDLRRLFGFLMAGGVDDGFTYHADR